MRKFVCKVASFLALTAVSAAIVVAVALPVRLALGEKNLCELFAIPQGVEVLGLGNSHVECTWDDSPQYKLYVLRRSGMPFSVQYLYILELERRGKLEGLKTLVMSAGLCGTEPENWIANEFWTHFPAVWRHWRRLPLRVQIKLFRPSRIFASWETCVSGVNRDPRRAVRWIDRTKEWKADNIKHYYPNFADGTSPYPIFVDADKIRMVNDINKICRMHGIRFILYAAPLAPGNPYREYASDNAANFAEEARLLQEMGVEFYDFSASLPDEWFFDCHHLSPEGAREFTRLFYDRYLREQPSAPQDAVD